MQMRRKTPYAGSVAVLGSVVPGVPVQLAHLEGAGLGFGEVGEVVANALRVVILLLPPEIRDGGVPRSARL